MTSDLHRLLYAHELDQLAVPRPDGTNPEGFARRVATAYTAAVGADPKRPAQLIADASHVPVTTVHRWIREARRAGALAATLPGSTRGSTAWDRVAADLGVPVGALRQAVAKHGRLTP